mmetsp:Transcript_69002/g.195555  ORF Transcript_69002/g.195555 Transcript_69002/m.195555 type:complete len:245 (-) Transcript_69002:824-1558(-)
MLANSRHAHSKNNGASAAPAPRPMLSAKMSEGCATCNGLCTGWSGPGCPKSSHPLAERSPGATSPSPGTGGPRCRSAASRSTRPGPSSPRAPRPGSPSPSRSPGPLGRSPREMAGTRSCRTRGRARWRRQAQRARRGRSAAALRRRGRRQTAAGADGALWQHPCLMSSAAAARRGLGSRESPSGNQRSAQSCPAWASSPTAAAGPPPAAAAATPGRAACTGPSSAAPDRGRRRRGRRLPQRHPR